MELESYFDYSEPGQIRIRGTRVDLFSIVKLYAEGYNPGMIVQLRPSLQAEQVYAAIAYYLHNRSEIDQYVREGDEQAEREYQEARRGPQHPAMERIRALLKSRTTANL